MITSVAYLGHDFSPTFPVLKNGTCKYFRQIYGNVEYVREEGDHINVAGKQFTTSAHLSVQNYTTILNHP